MRFLTMVVLAAGLQSVDPSALRSSDPQVRVKSLVAIRGLAGEHPELLEPVAASLEDSDPEVQVEAAYTLAQLAVRAGCDLTAFLHCSVFEPLLDHAPVPQTQLQIRYPDTAKQSRVQGTVVVQFLVLEDGSVSDVTLVKGEPLLADPVLAALKTQRYRPASRNGRAVPFAYVFGVSFKLTR